MYIRASRDAFPPDECGRRGRKHKGAKVIEKQDTTQAKAIQVTRRQTQKSPVHTRLPASTHVYPSAQGHPPLGELSEHRLLILKVNALTAKVVHKYQRQIPTLAIPTFPYVVVNAFTWSSLGGNPAVIVLLPPGSLATNTSPPVMDTPAMIALAKSFAQPISVFLAPPRTRHGRRHIRYQGLLPGVRNPGGEDNAVKFRTAAGMVNSARAAPSPMSAHQEDDNDGEFYEIELPSSVVQELTREERDRFVARGGGKMGKYLMVVLDEHAELEGRDINIPALLETGPFGVISLTRLTPDEDHTFVSRTFAPANGIMEDHVCGGAHNPHGSLSCLMYSEWAEGGGGRKCM
ncbi:hypothetical protein BU15DRAFT_79840 [Melanogaster broomeanus]|nr:hypothetical protein BU15DRAFT_79840 [Melanogaster broomeanus]